MKKNIFKKFPLVTLYVVTKNHEKYVAKCIKSALNQSYHNIELHIIDDNSSDKTVAQISKIISKKKKIKFFKNKKTLGLQKIANQVIKNCNGDYLLRLDGDDWLDENAILNLVTKAISDKKIGAVCGSYYYVNNKNDIIGEEKNPNKNNDLIAPHGACTLFKNKILKEMGGYAIDVKSQDGWDAWYKIRKKYKIAYVITSIFYYRQHSKSLTRSKNLLKDRNKILQNFYKLNFGDDNKKSVCIIPIKNNYIQKKNIAFMKYKKKFLLDINIDLMLQNKSLNKLIISSSDRLIEKYLQKNYKRLFNSKIYFIFRPKKYDYSISSFQQSIEFVYEKFVNKYKYKSDIIFIKNFHTVTKDRYQLDRMKEELILGKKDIVFSVNKQRSPTFLLKNNRLNILNAGRFSDLEYKNEIVYNFDETSLAIKSNLIHNINLFNSKSGFVETNNKDVVNIVDN